MSNVLEELKNKISNLKVGDKTALEILKESIKLEKLDSKNAPNIISKYDDKLKDKINKEDINYVPLLDFDILTKRILDEEEKKNKPKLDIGNANLDNDSKVDQKDSNANRETYEDYRSKPQYKELMELEDEVKQVLHKLDESSSSKKDNHSEALNSRLQMIEIQKSKIENQFEEKLGKLDNVIKEYNDKSPEDYASEFDRLVDAERENNIGKSL